MRATSRPMPPSPDHAQGFAQQLHAFMRRPYAAAHFAVHSRDIAGARPHQGDGVLGDRSITVTFDDMHLDAAFIEFVDIHVTRRPCAQENDVLELRTLGDKRCRHVRMVIDCDVVAADDARKLVACKRLAVHVDRGITRPENAFPDGSQLSLQSRKIAFMRILVGRF